MKKHPPECYKEKEHTSECRSEKNACLNAAQEKNACLKVEEEKHVHSWMLPKLTNGKTEWDCSWPTLHPCPYSLARTIWEHLGRASFSTAGECFSLFQLVHEISFFQVRAIFSMSFVGFFLSQCREFLPWYLRMLKFSGSLWNAGIFSGSEEKNAC